MQFLKRELITLVIFTILCTLAFYFFVEEPFLQSVISVLFIGVLLTIYNIIRNYISNKNQ
ncbi:hypothetical protein Desor_2261 [Desulfosporosinus orientis DSM 765]|uniref:Uncharacterized protein n=1 Tax=Desulfosporosinus orientis (strain ATCC 19365 / DSM 765 / NCIMB 8382 / VKM B-1628 / Singapore I) TaxID=768706 RepID=G7WB78_DESOD|nr:hypothetical protein Desor_2261 [Desulfosporosinus orientis DSM 765]